jgi:mono/diheme cytochrome c family protein
MLAAALLVAVAATGQTQQPEATGEAAAAERTQPTQLERGAARYQRYCAACHGKSADGNGPMASSLRQAPSDLRRIAARNGGRFDRRTIAAQIDGRGMAAAHGSEESPVWGWKGFRARKGSGGTPSPRMLEILAYLESIQIPAEVKPQS